MSSEFDHKFDQGKDVTADLDLSTIRRPKQKQRRVNADFPTWMIESLDSEASRLGVTRQSIIKVWIAERLERKVERQALSAGDSFAPGSLSDGKP